MVHGLLKDEAGSEKDGLTRYRREGGTVFIDIRMRQWRQLFDSKDPAPFRDRDLDDDAVDYIVNSFREVRGLGAAKLILHLSETREASIAPDVFVDAIHFYFQHEYR